MEFHQRDIVLVHFPFTDLTQTKLRPALIISADQINKSGNFVCVQITSRPISDESYFRLEKEMLEGSLLLTSGIRLHKIFCLQEKFLEHKIAALTPVSFDLVLDSLRDRVFTFRD